MTDTGQVPGEGLPASAGMVEQPGVHAPGAYTYLSETAAEDEDLLLPGARGAWGNEVPPPAPEPIVQVVHEPGPHEPGPHETDGRDSGAVDLSAVRMPGPSAVASEADAVAPEPGRVRMPVATPVPQPPVSRRPLHLGPPTPDGSTSPVRSLADRGPADAPVPLAAVRRPESPSTGPEYLDAPQSGEDMPQPASPWAAVPVTTPVMAEEPAGAEPMESGGAPCDAHEEREAPADEGAPSVEEASDGAAVEGAPDGTVATVGAVAATVVPESGQGAGTPTASAPAPDPGAVGETLTPEPETPEAEQSPELHDAVDGSLEPQAPDPTSPPATPAPAQGPVPAPEVPQVTDGAAPAADAPVPVPEEAAETDTVAIVPDLSLGSPDQPTPQEQPTAQDQPVPAEPQSVPEQQQGEEAPASQEPRVQDPVTEDAPPVPAEPAEQAADDGDDGAAGEAADALQPQPAEGGHELADPAAHMAVAASPGTEEVAPHAEATDAQRVDPAAQVEAQAPSGAEAAPAPEEPLPAPVPPDQTDQHGVPVEQPAPAEARTPVAEPAAAEPSQAVPDGVATPTGGGQPAVDQPIGQFVPVDGTVPTTPHLAPTPPHGMTVPPQEAEDQPAAPETDTPVAADAVAQEAAPPSPQDAAATVVEGAPLPEGAQPAVGAEPTTPSSEDDPTAPATAEEPPAATADETPPATAPDDRATPPDRQPPATSDQAQSSPPVEAPDAALDLAPTAAPEAAEAPTAETTSATVLAPREPGAPETHAAPTAPEAPGMTQSSDPEPLAADAEADVVQHAEDLDTRAADHEESTAAVEDARKSTGPAAPGYDEAAREAVLRVMRERRDIRNGFRGDPIPHEVLLRVLEAAHTAPSVGHSQPWDFVVIRSAETRRTMHELAQRQREAYAKSLPKGRAKQFKELKIEAILDTPVNIVVTADPTRGGRHTLGRHTQPQMAPYSSALAVENLWLAARAEGLGVGWVSFFDEREMVSTLGLPEHLEVVAYLCVGYVDEFPEEPELMQAGWAKRRPLSWVVHEETYGRRALPGEEPHDLLAETVASIRPLDAKALGEAWQHQKRMTKPAGALGMLEIISAQLSGLSRQCPPPIPEPAAVAIFAGDHGVHAQGVTPWPQQVTAQMVANFLGGGAVCNAFAQQVGAEVCVIDVGVASDLPATPGLLPRKVRAGTADMTTGPALTREEVKQAIEVGIETARDLVAAGNKALLTGEMGIANTTASAALIAVFTDADPSEVTGRGTGINDETLARKTEVVRRAIELHQPDPADPIGVLAAFGGLEHAALVGLLLGGSSLRTPVILDGVSAGAAALVARAIAPEVLAACIAGHRSAEPGHVVALKKLGLRPLVDLDLRLGEGTGALLALPMVQSTARAMHEVATFDSAGVTEK